MHNTVKIVLYFKYDKVILSRLENNPFFLKRYLDIFNQFNLNDKILVIGTYYHDCLNIQRKNRLKQNYRSLPI